LHLLRFLWKADSDVNLGRCQLPAIPLRLSLFIVPVKYRQQCFSCAKADFLTADRRFVKQSFWHKAAQSQLFFYLSQGNANQPVDL
jgi:hypothetical protein